MIDDIAAFAHFIVVTASLVSIRNGWSFEVAVLVGFAAVVATLGRMIPA